MTSQQSLFVAPVTPMHADGSLALDRIEQQAQLLLQRGAEGFYLCGNTGEGYHLTVDERMQLVRRWREVIGDRVPLFVHVGSVCLKDSCALAAYAQRVGASAVSSLGPAAASGNLEAIINWSAAIAAAAPQLPFLHYHYAGFSIRMAEYCPLALQRIGNFGGLKYTHSDLMDLSLALSIMGERGAAYYGYDQMLLYGLICGAQGLIGGSYNLTSPLVVKIREALHQNNLAEAQMQQRKLQEVITTLSKHGGGIPAMKAAMRLLGLECGPTRQPAKNIGEQAAAAMLLDLEKVWPEAALLPDSEHQCRHAPLAVSG
ncbi:MAG: dihydrodipicolinate synthase family protein [Phycisphaeraceae bacterium]|nr:dihydrodipicolinate synthase family protein [Phycisphaeraceae bacterium]